MSKKLYFIDEDAEHCYGEQYFQRLMSEEGKQEIEVMEAVRAIGVPDFMYCKEYVGVFEKGECGKVCPAYLPRNGKSGCCKHVGKLYEHGEKITLKQVTI